MLFPELHGATTCSWNERDLPPFADAFERRQPDISDDVLDDTGAPLSPTSLIFAKIPRSRTVVIDGDLYLSTLLKHIWEAYRAELGIHVHISGALGSVPAHIARNLGLVLIQIVVLSARYGLCKGPGRIAIEIIRSTHRVRIRVSNTGIGEIDPLALHQRDMFRLINILASTLNAKVSVHSHPSLGPLISLTTGQFSSSSAEAKV